MKRPSEDVVIPMIALIEGGMRIPMGIVSKNFLCLSNFVLLSVPPNMFTILGNIDALNKKMGVNPTPHDIK